MEKGGYIYILTNRYHTTLYTGVTSDIQLRIYQHKNNIYKGFTTKYNVHKLVYVEGFHSIEEAIIREKQIKGGSREKKINLINKLNPNWEELNTDDL